MRCSQLFGHTLRDDPADAETASHRLLLRGGFIRPMAAGIYSFLPLGLRVKANIESILREEIDRIGGQELLMPVVTPADLWRQSGRWESVGAEMGRFQDRAGRDLALAMTHEEAATFLGSSEVRSYRDLPRLIYHIQTKWRDDPRPRAGLIRVREFTMLDSYSFDAGPEGMESQYRAVFDAYQRIFRRCGLPVIAVGADAGMMGGATTHEFMYPSSIGEDTILQCDGCGYAANRQVARFQKAKAAEEEPLPVERVATPSTTSIEELTSLLGVTAARTAKAVFFMADVPDEKGAYRERFVFGIVRGDMDINETKLANVVHARSLRPAREEEIRAVGAEPGYASPLGVQAVLLVADDSIPESPNLIAGANQPGFHLRNVNYARDYTADHVADIAAAFDGAACPHCGQAMRALRGVEVANIFQLGTRYSEPLQCHYLDSESVRHPVWMGSHGIGVGRLMACIAEEHHDDFGLLWPAAVAPFDVALLGLGCETEAGRLYGELQDAGWDVLYDDREDRAGVKFMDADRIGCPIRLTVSDKALQQGGIEFKRRDRAEKTIVPRADLETAIRRTLEELMATPSHPT
jgi:prolyl-tRNA synthetase